MRNDRRVRHHEDSIVLSVLISLQGLAYMFCRGCNQELSELAFRPTSRKRWFRGKTKSGTCRKCLRKQALVTLENYKKHIAQCSSGKKIAKMQKRIDRLEYQLFTRPRLLSAKRRARQLEARPPWVEAHLFRPIYEECVRKSRETGIEHHVDHIVPLQGKNVCGLDVPWNLQILKASENCAKSNLFGEELAQKEFHKPWGGHFA